MTEQEKLYRDILAKIEYNITDVYDIIYVLQDYEQTLTSRCQDNTDNKLDIEMLKRVTSMRCMTVACLSEFLMQSKKVIALCDTINDETTDEEQARHYKE